MLKQSPGVRGFTACCLWQSDSCEPVSQTAASKDQMILLRHLLIKTDMEFTPTASMSISEVSKKLGDLVFIKIILIIKGDTMCAQSWLPTQAEEEEEKMMMISTITEEKPGLGAGRQRGTCDHQSIIEHEPQVKTGPAFL